VSESEKKSRATPSKNAVPAKGTKRAIAAQDQAKKAKPAPARTGKKTSPRWWAPTMVALMLIGLVIVVLAYIFGGTLPVPTWGNGNLFLGIGTMLVGFLMTLGWH
jgi:hypothetical protein